VLPEGAVPEVPVPDVPVPEVDGVEGGVAGATLGLVAEVAGLEGGVDPLGAASDAALGTLAAGGPLGAVSALAGRASIAARKGTVIRLRNSGEKAERRIC
jgi:hypothetical protein